MLARVVERVAGESSLGAGGATVGGLRLDWKYRRYDLRPRARDLAAWAYPRPLAPHLAVGVVGASGMSAVAAALVALDDQLGGPPRLVASVETYFETAQLANTWLAHLALTPDDDELRPGDVLFLDSIERRDPRARLRGLEGLAAIVCDTTCWDATGDETADVVARATAAGVPLVLVRSHLKLDCLGLEYGRLGTAVVVLPRPASRPSIALARALRLRMLDFLAKSGATVAADAIFPLADEPRFWHLNARRNALLRRSNVCAAQQIAARLDGSSTTRVDGYHHGEFLLVRPLVDTQHAVWSAAPTLVRALADAGLDARMAPSFGYDFAAVTFVAGAQYQASAALRLSLPDLDDADLAVAVRAVADWALGMEP